MATNIDKKIENSPSEKGDHTGVSFQIRMNDEKTELDRPRSVPPKRLRNYRKKTVTKEDLDQKQLEAENRRKKIETEMLKRVQQTREEVEQLNKNFSALLAQDAKRQGDEGTSDISSMTPQQLKEKFRAVNKDYKQLVSSITSTAQVPD